MKEKLFFEDSKGNKLCGILSNPTSDKNKAIIILCHGLASSKESRTYTSLETLLNKNSVSTFRFDFFGHGESEGKFENLTITKAVDDISKAIKTLKKLGYKKIGLMGSSFGGIAGIMAASKIKGLIVLALKSPVSNYEEKTNLTETKTELNNWKAIGYRYYEYNEGKKLKLGYAFLKDFKNNDGYKAAKKIKIPTLIVHGDKDESVPVEQSIKTSKIIESCKLEIVKGADHQYSNPKDRERMLKLISKFIIKNS